MHKLIKLIAFFSLVVLIFLSAVWVQAAQSYLTLAGLSNINQGQAQRIFTTQGSEFYEPLKYAQYNASPEYRDFMWNTVGINTAPPANASAAEKNLYQAREAIRLSEGVNDLLVSSIPAVMAFTSGRVLAGKAYTTTNTKQNIVANEKQPEPENSTNLQESSANTVSNEKPTYEQIIARLNIAKERYALLQQQARLNEITDIFKPGSTQSFKLTGQKILLENTNSSGTTKLFNTAAIPDAQLKQRVFSYASELSAGASFKAVDQGIWATKLPDGTTINVRNVSSSRVGRWTVEIKGNLDLQTLNPSYKRNSYELKFK